VFLVSTLAQVHVVLASDLSSVSVHDTCAAITTLLLHTALVEDDACDEERYLVDVDEQDCRESVIAHPIDRLDRRQSCRCDCRKRDTDADIFDGIVDTILRFFLWVGTIVGAGDDK
jgi:hypothetical protein